MVFLRSIKFDTRIYISHNDGKELLYRFTKGSNVSTELINPDGYKMSNSREDIEFGGFYDSDRKSRKQSKARISKKVGTLVSGLKFKKGKIKTEDEFSEDVTKGVYSAVAPKTEEDAFRMYLSLTDAESYGFVSSGKDLKAWIGRVKKDKDAWNLLKGKLYVEDHGKFCLTKIALREEEKEVLQNYIDEFERKENVLLTFDSLFSNDRLKDINLYDSRRIGMIEKEFNKYEYTGHKIHGKIFNERGKRFGEAVAIGLSRDDYKLYENILDGKVIVNGSVVTDHEEMLKTLISGVRVEIEKMTDENEENKVYRTMLDAVETISKFSGKDGVRIESIEMANETLISYADEIRELSEKNKILDNDNIVIKNAFHEINEAYEELSGEKEKLLTVAADASSVYDENLERKNRALKHLGGFIRGLRKDKETKDSRIKDLEGSEKDYNKVLQENEKFKNDFEGANKRWVESAEEVKKQNNIIKEMEGVTKLEHGRFEKVVGNLKGQLAEGVSELVEKDGELDIANQKLRLIEQDKIPELTEKHKIELDKLQHDKEVAEQELKYKEYDYAMEIQGLEESREILKAEKLQLRQEQKGANKTKRVLTGHATDLHAENIKKEEELLKKQETLEIQQRELRVAQHQLKELHDAEILRKEYEDERETVFSKQLEDAREEFKSREVELKKQELELTNYRLGVENREKDLQTQGEELKDLGVKLKEQRKELKAREDAVEVDDNMNGGVKKTIEDQKAELAREYEAFGTEQKLLDGKKATYEEDFKKYMISLDNLEEKDRKYRDDVLGIKTRENQYQQDLKVLEERENKYQQKLKVFEERSRVNEEKSKLIVDQMDDLKVMQASSEELIDDIKIRGDDLLVKEKAFAEHQETFKQQQDELRKQLEALAQENLEYKERLKSVGDEEKPTEEVPVEYGQLTVEELAAQMMGESSGAILRKKRKEKGN
jgi:hypothetical protein